MRRFGYSQNKRSDCLQIVIALIVPPEGFPIAYEVLPGNTPDKTTLAGFLKKKKLVATPATSKSKSPSKAKAKPKPPHSTAGSTVTNCV